MPDSNLSALQSVNFDSKNIVGRCPSISYHFHEKSFDTFQTSLTQLEKKDKYLLIDILTEKYQPKKPPQDVLQFLTGQTGLDIKEIAKKLFIFLDLTAGKDDSNIHTGVNMNMFNQDFMLAFFKARQTAIIVEKYPKKEENKEDFIAFRGVPYADLSHNHLKKVEASGDYKISYDHQNDAKTLVANSYMNVLEAAVDFLSDNEMKKTFTNLKQRIKHSLSTSGSGITFSTEDLLQIQQAAVTVKIAMAKKAQITPMLNVPGVFAGKAWQDEFDKGNRFTTVVEDVLKNMKPENRPDKVVVNQGRVVVLSVNSATKSITKGDSATSYDPYIVNKKSRWDTLVNRLGLQNLALDKCAANFPMIGLESGIFSISSGKKPSTSATTAEESINGMINTDYQSIGGEINILIDDKKIGETSSGKKETCSASNEFYIKQQISQTLDVFCQTNNLGDNFYDAVKKDKFKIHHDSYIYFKEQKPDKQKEQWNNLMKNLPPEARQYALGEIKVQSFFQTHSIKCGAKEIKSLEDALNGGYLKVEITRGRRGNFDAIRLNIHGLDDDINNQWNTLWQTLSQQQMQGISTFRKALIREIKSAPAPAGAGASAGAGAPAPAEASAPAQVPAPAEASAPAQVKEVVLEETQIPATTCCCCGCQWLVESIQNWLSCNSR